MSAVLDKFPTPKRKMVITAICLASGCFCLVMAGFAVQLTYGVFHRGQVSPALRVPIWYMYISTPAGFFLTGIYYIGAFIRNLTGPGTYFGLENPH